ncbi:gamma-glutamylcyclotransferase family protein [Methylocystis sp. JR02]|uniref:gamma-glutamylcyclotransferase family protein n=1 Tax=Methylocystis sp. JR02 TaxID=3046284 RepID=UPI0024BA5325|nr:gamma-glutamylcyclotransferase family protein [Methylocystis sp. JR02]MDJ0447554.1 gamma-glutamylcyclotransferase family protein [Methylocystis sp. JR02]
MPLHFAYGSNMDAAAMARRCPRSRLLGRARLARWRFVILPSGFASVVPDARAAVHGALWDVPASDVAALDRYEQVGQGLYAKKIIPVLREPFGASPALVYIGAAPPPGAAGASAWPGYLADIIAAAQALELPAAHVAYLAYLAAEQKKGR